MLLVSATAAAIVGCPAWDLRAVLWRTHPFFIGCFATQLDSDWWTAMQEHDPLGRMDFPLIRSLARMSGMFIGPD